MQQNEGRPLILHIAIYVRETLWRLRNYEPIETN